MPDRAQPPWELGVGSLLYPKEAVRCALAGTARENGRYSDRPFCVSCQCQRTANWIAWLPTIYQVTKSALMNAPGR